MKDWAKIFSWAIDRWEQFWSWLSKRKRRKKDEAIDHAVDNGDESRVADILRRIKDKIRGQ